MDKRTLDILEYSKIIDKLAAECCSQMTREAALKLHPSYKLTWISEELQGKTAPVLFHHGRNRVNSAWQCKPR